MKTYEAMFLLEPVLATDWPAAEAEINRVLDRAGAKVIGIKNWGERKLAYSIGHRKRGLYVLSFFQAMPEKISGLERDVQLSEKAVRVLVLKRDTMSPEDIEKALNAEPPAARLPSRGEEGEGRARGGKPADVEAGAGRTADDRGASSSEADAARGDDLDVAATFDPDQAMDDDGR